MTIPFKRLEGNNNPLPSRETEHSAGLDLRSTVAMKLLPGQRALISTGFAAEIPSGHVGLVCPRSGLALKHGITALNSPGVIDADYRGAFGVILVNHGNEPFDIAVGDRIAQLVIMPVAHFRPIEVDDLSGTERGAGGFGSTGVV